MRTTRNLEAVLHLSPHKQAETRIAFRTTVNMSAREIARWLKTAESRQVGTTRPGERETVGRQSARRIIAILGKVPPELEDNDYAHMRRVIGFCRRHLAKPPAGDVTHTRWRWSLMNWGHDPLKQE